MSTDLVTQERPRPKACKKTKAKWNKVLKAFKKTGIYREACKMAEISEDSFYRWKREYPEFEVKVTLSRYRFVAPGHAFVNPKPALNETEGLQAGRLRYFECREAVLRIGRPYDTENPS